MAAIKYFFLVTVFISHLSFACDKSLKIGIGPHWPPYVSDDGESFSGIDVKIIRLVLDEADFCYTFFRLPSSQRGLVELKKGALDLMPAASYSSERAQYSYFTQAYRHEKTRLFWHQDSKYRDSTLAGLMAAGQTFVINNGGYYGRDFDQLSKQTDFKRLIVKVPNIEQRLHMLVAKRVDFMIDDEVSGLYLINQENIKGLSLHPYIVNDNPIHLMLSRASMSKVDVARINTAIAKKETEIEDIIHNLIYSER